jgi:hypothetical protein
MARLRQGEDFKGRQFTAEAILWAVGWYLMFPNYRDLADLELMLRFLLASLWHKMREGQRWWPGFLSAPYSFATDRFCVGVSGTFSGRYREPPSWVAS